ncbi:MAG: transmembrane domain-containing protein [Pirellulales bacterium]
MSRLGCLIVWAGAVGTSFWTTSARAQLQPADGREAVGTARQLFDLFGIDEASFQQFTHGESLKQAEHEQVARLLMRLPQVKLVDVKRWTKRGVAWDDVAWRPGNYQREFVRVEGRARKVTRIVPAAEMQDRYALESYYRCEMSLGDDQQPAVVFARAVPQKWPIDQPLNERASASAMFLKTGADSAAGKSELYFAADRIAWNPDTPLGTLGMDYGLFDTVEQQRPITNQDRECFYQMLAAAGRAPAAATVAVAADPTSQLGPLMRKPQDHVGEPYSFRGVARRAVKIHISDPDTVARLGFDHYFELVVFLDLDGVLEVAGQKVGSYPVIYCVRELPPGMPTGDEIGESVRASGFMFKKWPYTTEMTEEQNPGLRMTSPLLIGRTVIWERRDTAQSLVGPVTGGILAAMIIALVVFGWWFGRRERRTHEALVAKRHAAQADQSLNDLKLDVPE